MVWKSGVWLSACLGLLKDLGGGGQQRYQIGQSVVAFCRPIQQPFLLRKEGLQKAQDLCLMDKLWARWKIQAGRTEAAGQPIYGMLMLAESFFLIKHWEKINSYMKVREQFWELL